MPFVKSPKSNLGHRAIQAEAERDYSIPHAREKIIKVLSDMLKRNSTFDIINSNDELELWRRPIYYTRNVFPLVDENGNDNVERELNDQLSYLEEGKNKVTYFCITEEGYTFIERIVTTGKTIDEAYIENVLPEKMKYNLEYTKNCNSFMDIKLCIKTII